MKNTKKYIIAALLCVLAAAMIFTSVRICTQPATPISLCDLDDHPAMG